MISVIIPVYNEQAAILGCLQSVAAQRGAAFEVLVVDNASTDDTAAVVAEFCAGDERFRLLSCPEKGVSHARNHGIQNARGTHLYFLDADDALAGGALGALAACAGGGADMVMHNVLVRQNGGEETQDDPAAPDTLARGAAQIGALFYAKMPRYLTHNVFKLYRREFLQQQGIRFDTGYSLGEDLLFNLQVFQKAGAVQYLGKTLYIHQLHGRGLNLSRRADMVETKLYIAGRLKSYLESIGRLDEEYYLLFLNDVFAMAANAQSVAEIREILALEPVQALCRQRLFGRLGFAKKIVWLCLKMKMAAPLYLAGRLWARRFN